MKFIKFLNCFSVPFFILLFTVTSWSQAPVEKYYDVLPGSGHGIRLWSNNNNNNYKIHMGNSSFYKYGPVTDYSIKTNMNDETDRGWTWGVQWKQPVVAFNTEGKLQTKSWIKSMGRLFYFGDVQYLYGDNSSALYYRSNNNNFCQFIMRDKQGQNYGRLYGSMNGANFGLLDGDGNWSYMAVKDKHTSFLINASEKMRIRSDGKVGIGFNIDYSPSGYRLFVQGGVLAEKVKVALESSSDWADYVFDADYDLISLEEVDQYVKANNHLPNVPSAEEVVDGGIDVAKMDAKLLEKIEELTLYLIDINEQVKQLKTENNQLYDLLNSPANKNIKK